MAFRFTRRVKIAPGLSLNLSKSGMSLSAGPRGAKITVGSRGVRATAGLPGTGLYYTEQLSSAKESRQKGSIPANPSGSPSDQAPLSIGFFKGLITPSGEKTFVQGCRELSQGNIVAALESFKESLHLAESAYLAGFLALKRESYVEASLYLESVAKNLSSLGALFTKYGMSATISLPITDELSVQIGPDLYGVLLGLVEAYQGQGRLEDAVACLKRLRQMCPGDDVVKLSLAEFLLENWPTDSGTCQTVVHDTEGIENDNALSCALLLYRARALRLLGLSDAAQHVLTSALRKTQDRPRDLLLALRYERVLVYEALGHDKRARTDLEKLYAEAPDYEDVAQRLELR